MRLVIFIQRPKDGSDVSRFEIFDNSTCKRVLGLKSPLTTLSIYFAHLKLS